MLDGAGLCTDAIYDIFPGDRFSASSIPDLLQRPHDSSCMRTLAPVDFTP